MAKADGAAVAGQLRELVRTNRAEVDDMISGGYEMQTVALLYADLLGRLTGALSMLADELEAHHG